MSTINTINKIKVADTKQLEGRRTESIQIRVIFLESRHRTFQKENGENRSRAVKCSQRNSRTKAVRQFCCFWVARALNSTMLPDRPAHFLRFGVGGTIRAFQKHRFETSRTERTISRVWRVALSFAWLGAERNYITVQNNVVFMALTDFRNGFGASALCEKSVCCFRLCGQFLSVFLKY